MGLTLKICKNTKCNFAVDSYIYLGRFNNNVVMLLALLFNGGDRPCVMNRVF